jgi:hypothetical protein
MEIGLAWWCIEYSYICGVSELALDGNSGKVLLLPSQM